MKKIFLVLNIITLSLMCGCQAPCPLERKGDAQNIRLDPLFTNHMVLQRNRVIKIRGWSEAGSKVKVSLASKNTVAVAGQDGEWIAELPAMKAGGPYQIAIHGDKIVKVLDDILIGDVWICSGQSNMAMSVSRSLEAEVEIKNANYSNIRFFKVNNIPSPTPLKELFSTQGWKVCSPKTAPSFSAVGYFFGRELHSNLDVPIGLINTSWGGTVAEAWTSLEMLRTLPSFKNRIKDTLKYEKKSTAEKKKMLTDLNKEINLRNAELKSLFKIEADIDYAKKMAAPELDESSWKVMTVPTIWENAGLKDFDGVVIFRKTIDAPKSWKGKEIKLALGPIDEVDVTYFNGVKVGGKGSSQKNITKYWNQARLYTVPGELVKAGKNTVTCFVYDLKGSGGLAGGEKDDMKAYLSGTPENSIPLAGSWKYKPGFQVRSKPNNAWRNMPNKPAFLFNSMVNPLVQFPITGAIWYQGESNASRAYQYRRLFPAMIQDWRIRWQQGDFPFYFVQLANYRARKALPRESDWAELREAQTMTLRLPNTGMAVIIDIGDAKDIHPKNKQGVGKRLAHNALSKHYKQNIIPSGPLYKAVKFKNGKAILTFNKIGKGLMAKSETLKGFAIAGEGKKFVWANAEIKNDKIFVWHNKIKKPVAVRYAWASNPECNLYNKEGLPASPFRTDDWAGITRNKK